MAYYIVGAENFETMNDVSYKSYKQGFIEAKDRRRELESLLAQQFDGVEIWYMVEDEEDQNDGFIFGYSKWNEPLDLRKPLKEEDYFAGKNNWEHFFFHDKPPIKDKRMSFYTSEERRQYFKKYAKENGYNSVSDFIEDCVLFALKYNIGVK